MKHTYDNGLRIAMFPNKNALTASMNIFVKAGSVYEQPFQAGISHFLEHLMFKGSKKYPGDMLSRNTENLGGYINACTGQQETIYYIAIQKDGVEETLKMLVDTVSNPLIPEDEFLMEKNVIIEEIKRHSDNPTNVFFDEFIEEMFIESDVRKSILGTKDTVSDLKRSDIFDYYHDFYTLNNILIVISGNFEEKKSEQIILEGVSNLKKKSKKIDLRLTEKPRPHKDTVKKGRVELSYLLGGFLIDGIDTDEIYTADIASAIFGGGKVSRLYKTLKDEKRLVYAVKSDLCPFEGAGLLYFYAPFEEKNLDAIKDEIHKQTELIIEKGITQEELNIVKASIKTHWIFAQETPSEIAFNKGTWILRNRENVLDDYVRRIDEIKTEDIRDFFKKHYSKQFMPISALLPQ